MVTTKKDGTKIKEYLNPEDPRISEIGVTKKIKMSLSDNSVNNLDDSRLIETCGKREREEVALRAETTRSNIAYKGT